MSDEGTASFDHTIYYNQAKVYVGDLIDISLADLDRVSCLLLVSLYFLMIHKPYRYAT